MKSRISELVAGGSLEISPREMHRLEEVAALLPKDTCVYIPSLPGLPLSRTLEMVAALRAAGLDPVPHVSARRVLDRAEFTSFLKEATTKHGVHRVLVIGGDEPKAKGPFNDSLEVLRSGLLGEAGIREIGVSGYPEGHPRIANDDLEKAFKEKVKLAAEQGLGLYVVTQFSFSPTRIVEFCAQLARSAPAVGVYVGIAGPSDPAALLRCAPCAISAPASRAWWCTPIRRSRWPRLAATCRDARSATWSACTSTASAARCAPPAGCASGSRASGAPWARQFPGAPAARAARACPRPAPAC
jgi:methylenetetrahydrofolate reductase (NADPH)